MEGLLLQDYITLRGAQGETIVQPRYGWFDLGDIEDVVLYIDVREVTGPPTLTFQTAPAAIDSAFVTLVPGASLALGLTTTSVMARFAKVPPARFLRWSLSLGANWDATFRIWVAGYGFT